MKADQYHTAGRAGGLQGRVLVEKKAFSTIDFESAKADMGYKDETNRGGAAFIVLSVVSCLL